MIAGPVRWRTARGGPLGRPSTPAPPHQLAPRAIHDQGRAALAAKSLTASSRAWSAANSLHKIHFRRVRRDVEALVAGLAENVPAHTDARFEVKTMGVTIRAPSGVERNHNTHTVPMVLADIFDHNGNNTQNVAQ